MKSHLERAQPSLTDEITVDGFCGGGGWSTGFELAIGKPVDIGINHDAAAIALHKKNHPYTKHYNENIWEVDPTVGHTGAHTERNRKQFRTGTPAPRRLLDGVGSAGHIRPKGPASGVAVMGQAKPMTAIVIASIRKAVNNGDPKECKPIQVLHPVSVRVRSQVCVLGVKSPCLGENETGEQAACKAQAAQIRECILQKDGEENG